MLVTSALLPCPSTAELDNEKAISLIELFNDMRINGIVLLQNQSDILDILASLPPKYKTRFQHCIDWLNNRHRYSIIPVTDVATDSEEDCTFCPTIDWRNISAGISRVDSCSSHLKSEVVGLGDYEGISQFRDNLRFHSFHDLEDEQWDRDRLATEVFKPIFRYTKSVRIYDRMLGRTIAQNSGCIISPNYSRSLKWIYDLFIQNSLSDRDRRFEIITGTGTARSVDPSRIISVLRTFAREASHNQSVDIDIKVYKERNGSELHHDRYLATDQVALWVGQGFDLVKDNNRVRGTSISVKDPHIGVITNYGARLSQV